MKIETVLLAAGGDAPALARWLQHFLLVLFARHWMIGATNAGLTALLGLALVSAGRPLRLPTGARLRLRHWVLLAAVFKGALYLVLGESMHAGPGDRWIVGVQLPDPLETSGLWAQSGHSIWHPTEVSHWVSLALLLYAGACLLGRLSEILRIKRALAALAALGGGGADPRLVALLQRAARSLPLPPGRSLPKIMQADLPGLDPAGRTPLLLGLRRPLLLLSPPMAVALTDAEAEAVFRHELAHLVRRDHWWRWLLLWVTDVGRPTLLVPWLGAAAIGVEEELCDRLAVRSPQEAVDLARALRKAAAPLGAGGGPRDAGAEGRHPAAPAPPPAPGRPAGFYAPLAAAPLLLGGYASAWRQSASLRPRLAALLSWSRDLSARDAPASARSAGGGAVAAIRRVAAAALRRAGLLLLGLLLVCDAKFHLTLNLR